MTAPAPPPIDLHHKVQLGLLRALELQLRGGESRVEADATVERLLDFTRVHFEAEELLMEVHRYPPAEAHRTAHARLMGEVEGIARSYREGKGAAVEEAVARLRGWIVDHIDGMDAAFDGWCRENGVVLE
jgi:hemerythrin-like metal-binding protein